jgi:hypothetical protein
MLDTYRLMCAHTDRRRLSMSIVTIVPHLVRPHEFGSVEDCPLCSKVKLTKEAEAFLDVFVKNGGFMFSPSKDPSDVKSERYRSCIQELSRLQLGIAGSKPDELLPVEDLAYPGSLIANVLMLLRIVVLRRTSTLRTSPVRAMAAGTSASHQRQMQQDTRV